MRYLGIDDEEVNEVLLNESTMAEITKIVEELKSRVVAKKSDDCIVKITGDKEEIDMTLTRLNAVGIDKVSRSRMITL